MKDQRPTRWPCSADSSRKAGPSPRSLRKAETGVSVSSMKVSVSGMTLWSAATANEHPLGVGEREPAGVQEHREVVEDVGGLLGHAVVRLLARGARDLLGLLLDLGADQPGIGEQRRGVGALGTLRRARADRALERRQRLVRRERLDPALVEAGPLARVAGRARRLDEGEDGVRVAVVTQGANGLGVPRGRALVPQLAA